jgi:uncharacterized membrane protein YraQ (UPF0718 family)
MQLTPSLIQDGVTIFMGVVLEALPFVLLGVLVSAGIRRFATPERVSRWIPKHPLLAYPVAALMGIALPVCECGNLPVARQLIKQGMAPSQAITFLLSAPILNPAVFISTYAAFRFSPDLVAARFILGFLVAVLVGWFFAWRGEAKVVVPEVASEIGCAHGHGGVKQIVEEFFEMFAALSLGALIAAVVQVTIPRAVLTDLASNPALAIAVMMGLALIVSLCSNVDAFFALSFAGTFSASALLAFLVFGPMIDFRSLSLMRRSFTTKTIITVSILVAELVFLGSLLAHYGGFV